MNKIKSWGLWIIGSKTRIVWGVAIILLLLYVGVKVLGSQGAQTKYQTAKVERGTIVSSISASGTVLTANMINVTTSATGVVADVLVKDGAVVTKDQKIAEISLDALGAQKNAAAWSSYLSAKNSVDTANATLFTLQSAMFSAWDEFKTLAQNSTYQNSDGTPRWEQRALPEFHIAQKDWLAAEAKFKIQQAVIVQTQAALNSSWLSYQSSSSNVFAPMGGTITNVTIVPGMTLANGTSDTTETSGQRVAVINSPGPDFCKNLTSKNNWLI
ncbi:MAG: efflux RND transporter periplasmic adaptor subunit [Patescibacteria group bacterium]